MAQRAYTVVGDEGEVAVAGQTLQADEENLADSSQMAADFRGKALPVLRGLRVV